MDELASELKGRWLGWKQCRFPGAVMSRLSLLVALATVAATAGRPTSLQETAADPVEATVKAWSDVKLWINVGGQRSGWMRYRARWAEYERDKVVEVSVERATTGRYSQRFTAWLNPDNTLSPRAVRYSNDGYDWENVNGRMGMFKTPTPDNLSLLPELLAAARLPKEGDSLALALIDEYNHKGAEGTLKGAGTDAKATKVTLTAKAVHFAGQGGDATFWIGEQRTLTRARVSFAAKDKAPPEEWLPATDKEWTQDETATNEFRAACHLTLLTNLVMHFRAHDAEGNSKNDFWSGDVSGLYRYIAKQSGGPIALISREMAMADAAPLPAGPE